MDIDTSSWVVTDLCLVPLKDLKLQVPERGQIPKHLVSAAAIVGIPDVRSPEARTFIDRIQRRMQDSQDAARVGCGAFD